MVVFNAIAFLLVSGFLAVNAGGIRKATNEEFPFQVSITTPNKQHLCGGVIITPTWVLTTSECLEKYNMVMVSYGSVTPVDFIDSVKVVIQNEMNLLKKNRLALIKLKDEIKFSKTVAQAKLPTPKAQLLNTTRLSGWNFDMAPYRTPTLYVIEKYFVILQNCHSLTSFLPVPLAVDEFCGMDEEQQNGLSNPGTVVSKAGIALGILPRRPLALSEPFIFVKLSEHDQWIKDVLASDSQYISWVDNVPKDSGHGLRAMSFSLLMVLITCLFYL